jgi:glutamate formiminotransferase/glutamate formiminotransferase/formiminotetrahydrofolate cyclodeaminase
MARLLDVHSDGDHHRTVYTLVGEAGSLSAALVAGAVEAVRRIDIRDGRGQHPHVGALDVAPLVYLSARARGVACVEALVAADGIGAQAGVPVFLYGQLAAGRTRAQLRAGGASRLGRLISDGAIVPDFGPQNIHPSGGATLVAARPPLVAFNVQLAEGAGVDDAKRIAALIKDGGEEGLEGVRAIGVALTGARGLPVAQVSTNVERPLDVPLRQVVEAVRRHCGVAGTELVGLAPSAALADFPEDVPIVGFDRDRHIIENALGL